MQAGREGEQQCVFLKDNSAFFKLQLHTQIHVLISYITEVPQELLSSMLCIVLG